MTVTKYFLFLLMGCLSLGSFAAQKPVSSKRSVAEHLFHQGEFTRLKMLSDSLNAVDPQAVLSRQADSLKEIASRISLDFSLSEPKAEAQIRAKIGAFSLDEKKQWEAKGWLEYRSIDGQKRYFNRSVTNLKLRLNQYNDSVNHTLQPLDSLSLFCLRHTEAALAQTAKPGDLSLPVHFTITYTLSVKADVVPAGETIRCWLPYPKENRSRQSDVKLLNAWPAVYTIAPDSAGHRSIYMEQKAVKGHSTEFKIRFSYRGAAQYFDLNKLKIESYKKHDPLYKRYTAQQGPHIVFTPQIRALADKIVGRERHPVKIVHKLYDWINAHIIWSGALEYSTMKNIPQYVLDHRRGDCGMQTLLFMTMARYKGIPVKWQSGWMLHPDETNLHDWSEVYYEGVGWVPLDVSFGLQRSDNPAVRGFYITGIDAYRLIVNDETGALFTPRKQFVRSEPVDFQRGEVEWRGGNLYFNKWDYHMDVEYLP